MNNGQVAAAIFQREAFFARCDSAGLYFQSPVWDRPTRAANHRRLAVSVSFLGVGRIRLWFSSDGFVSVGAGEGRALLPIFGYDLPASGGGIVMTTGGKKLLTTACRLAVRVFWFFRRQYFEASAFDSALVWRRP